MSLGERIKEIRKDNHLTQKEFAEKISVSRPFISRIEANKEKPSETLLKLISVIFRIELEWLMSGSGCKESIRKTTLNMLKKQNGLSLEGFEQIDFAECSSILLHLLKAPHLKYNSERYYTHCIKSILTVLNSFFTNSGVTECEKEDIEATTLYIQKKIYEAIESFINEDMNDKI